MKTGIKIVSKNFAYVGRVTHCSIKAYVKLDDVLNGIGVSDIKKSLNNKGLLSKTGGFTVHATVTCSEDDTYDSDFGAKLAECKAMTMVFDRAEAIWKYVSEKLNYITEQAGECCNKAWRAGASELYYYKELSHKGPIVNDESAND